jgi:hypothetical protein
MAGKEETKGQEKGKRWMKEMCRNRNNR